MDDPDAPTPATRNSTDLAVAVIEPIFQRHVLNDEAWWDVAPAVIATPQGPRTVVFVAVHFRSMILSTPPGVDTYFELTSPLGAMDEVWVEGFMTRAFQQLRTNRASTLAGTNGHG